jgi:hypothetical protein
MGEGVMLCARGERYPDRGKNIADFKFKNLSFVN